jgi:hypothetical protein
MANEIPEAPQTARRESLQDRADKAIHDILDELNDELREDILDSQIELYRNFKRYHEARRLDDIDATVYAGVDISLNTWVLQDLYAVAEKRKLDVIEWRYKSHAEEITEWTQAILKEHARQQGEDFLRSLGIASMEELDPKNHFSKSNLVVMAKTAGGK